MATLATPPPAPRARLLDDPEVFLAVDDLDLVGRGLAEAVWHGAHHSLLRGDGVEFHSHRTYQAGDDLRRVNWSVYARQRKLYTKQSQQESRRPLYIFMDASASLSIQHGRYSKWHYATRAAAGMAHLARRQGDAPALGILQAGKLDFSLPARRSADHLTGLCAALQRVEPSGSGSLAQELLETQSFTRQRGFIILISDFLDPEAPVFNELASYRAQGHDVLALQILDPVEIALPKTGDYEFIDPETGGRIKSSTEPIHAAYAKRISKWRHELKSIAEANGLHWMSASTEDSLVAVLREWLQACQ
jgi:uncharacterized protein (DUF58 family)